jgi:hypothetical protein
MRNSADRARALSYRLEEGLDVTTETSSPTKVLNSIVEMVNPTQKNGAFVLHQPYGGQNLYDAVSYVKSY